MSKKKGKIEAGDIVIIKRFHPKSAHWRRWHKDNCWKLNEERFEVFSIQDNRVDAPPIYKQVCLTPIDGGVTECNSRAVVVARAPVE